MIKRAYFACGHVNCAPSSVEISRHIQVVFLETDQAGG